MFVYRDFVFIDIVYGVSGGVLVGLVRFFFLGIWDFGLRRVGV